MLRQQQARRGERRAGQGRASVLCQWNAINLNKLRTKHKGREGEKEKGRECERVQLQTKQTTVEKLGREAKELPLAKVWKEYFKFDYRSSVAIM